MQLNRKTVAILGVPADLGANMRGACMGPAAIRITGLKNNIKQLGYEVVDLGDLPVPIPDSLTKQDEEDHYLSTITALCSSLADKTYEMMKAEQFPVILGGDHSIAIGTISGVSRFFAERKQKMGLIWVDAHADMNTPDTSESGNIHGMPLAAVLGLGHRQLTQIGSTGVKVDPRNVVLIGIRTIDKKEKEILRKSGITYFTMRDIDEQGMYKVMTQALQLAGTGTQGIHLSFDIDGIDPQFAPGVSTPVPGGLNFREAHLIPEMLYESGKLASVEFVELNPLKDSHSNSAVFTMNLIESALGKTIV